MSETKPVGPVVDWSSPITPFYRVDPSGTVTALYTADQIREMVEPLHLAVTEAWHYDPGEWAAGEYREEAMASGLKRYRTLAIRLKVALDALLAQVEEKP